MISRTVKPIVNIIRVETARMDLVNTIRNVQQVDLEDQRTNSMIGIKPMDTDKNIVERNVEEAVLNKSQPVRDKTLLQTALSSSIPRNMEAVVNTLEPFHQPIEIMIIELKPCVGGDTMTLQPPLDQMILDTMLPLN
uniref:Uncharacterized protein n=1 Tax=Cacopsylla melanoneura TaxID=428564 RepID=A0A8D8M2N5_9HEMI